MKILIDTHIALWAITDDPRLPRVRPVTNCKLVRM